MNFLYYQIINDEKSPPSIFERELEGDECYFILTILIKLATLILN